MSWNDHRALTADQREELDQTAASIAMFLLANPNTTEVNDVERGLVMAMSHIEALDTRAQNLAAIFRGLQNFVDQLSEVPPGAVVEAKMVATKLNSLIQDTLTKL